MGREKARIELLRELEKKVEAELGNATQEWRATRAIAWAIYFFARVYMFKN